MNGSFAAEGLSKMDKRTINDDHRDLIEKARRMGITHEIKDLIDQVRDMERVLIEKNYELDVLEMLAMESDDENIINLREQLFTTVKLVHTDLINELGQELQYRLRDDIIKADMAPQVGSNSNENLLRRARDWYFKHKQIRKEMKVVKERLKNKYNHERHAIEGPTRYV